MTQIDTDKLRALHEAANSKTMHPEDVASARFQLGNFVKGQNFPAILAMAEDNRRLREALEKIKRCGTFQPHSDDPPSFDHYADIARQALAAPGDGG